MSKLLKSRQFDQFILCQKLIWDTFFDQQQDTADDISPQFESLSSENTVVENTPQQSFKNVDYENNDADFDDLSPSDIRARKGSYTLDHPSPVLVAYMTRIGKACPNMESPR